MRALYLYARFVSYSLRSMMQYRASFVMLLLAYFIMTTVDIIAIWALFDRFRQIQGWTLEEVAVLYGVVHIGFSVAESTARGFDQFDVMVKNGQFDRMLVRPLGTFFQVATSTFQWMRLGRLLQGAVVLIWGIFALELPLFSTQCLTICFAAIGTAALFYSLFVLQATLAFWTTETLEVMNVITFGGVECCQFPMSIYPRPFRLFFTFLIPWACVSYYPVATALDLETVSFWLGMIAPFVGLLFLLCASLLWRVGVRKYCSTGS